MLTKLNKIRLWQNFKKKNVAKLKNSNCDKTKKKQIVTKIERSTCDQTQKLKLYTIKKIKLWQLKNSNCDSNKNYSSDKSSYNDIFLWKHLNTLTTDHSQGSYSQLLRCLLNYCSVFYCIVFYIFFVVFCTTLCCIQ